MAYSHEIKHFREDLMKDIEKLKQQVNSLLASQRLAVLATRTSREPYTSLVAFAEIPDLTIILFATTRTTRKYANLLANSRVALLIDNRSNETADFRSAMAVSASGTAREVEDHERKGLLGIYLNKHPYLRDFVKAPTCALIAIKVEKYSVVQRFQHVVEFKIEP
jgi:nitroimidazol reductase NimA-like FMN-containing flavoprotein (pyridoxamine 5'-phosphate oxidase superfamily)